MYLKRFARHRAGGPQVAAMTPDLKARLLTSVNNLGVERGFYWGTDVDGVPHHHLEEFLTAVEGSAATAFKRVLDTGETHLDDALPPWPPSAEVRYAISWWMAAQILRTLRQRKRLDFAYEQNPDLTESRRRLELPDQFDSANRHIRYIAEMIKPLATAIFFRPWGVGFSDYCLLTGDVPVIVLNGQDHAEQYAAVNYWDVYMPVDSHRCLYLPGVNSAGDRHIRTDHRFKLHPGHAIALNSVMIETAVRHIFFHPDHDPTSRARPTASPNEQLSQFLLHYEVMPRGYGIERRWLDIHPQPASNPDAPKSEEEVVSIATQMAAELKRRQQNFSRGQTGHR